MNPIFIIIILIIAFVVIKEMDKSGGFEGYTNVFKCDSKNLDSCYNIHPSPGCNNGDIEHCVCNLDPFCCFESPNFYGTWDGRCTELANKCNKAMGAMF